MLDEGLGSTRARSVPAAQSTSKKLPAREFNGHQSPAPRLSCPKQAERHYREEVIGQHKSQKRTGYPKYEQKTSRGGV